MKFKILRYVEAYEEYEIEADTEDDAQDKVCLGLIEPTSITIKNSEIDLCQEIQVDNPTEHG